MFEKIKNGRVVTLFTVVLGFVRGKSLINGFRGLHLLSDRSTVKHKQRFIQRHTRILFCERFKRSVRNIRSRHVLIQCPLALEIFSRVRIMHGDFKPGMGRDTSQAGSLKHSFIRHNRMLNRKNFTIAWLKIKTCVVWILFLLFLWFLRALGFL